MDKSLRRAIKPVELRDLYRAAEDAGCRVSLTGGGHIKVETAQGSVFGPQTASCRRSLLNVRSQLRRLGVDV